jgi:peptidoglycan/LPS O-acetylase OafA/YrhL
VITTRKRDEPIGLSPRVSSELKGFAIIAIILAHIGYYLAQDHRFLFPLSVFAGVGVDLFLFLSGYGLAYSMLHKQLTLWQFYLRRVSRIFIPLWIILLTLFVIDKIFLDLSYPLKTILQSFVGFFPKAHLYESLNAPLWYLTFILFYYLLFPLVFWKKIPFLSAFFLAFLDIKKIQIQGM